MASNLLKILEAITAEQDTLFQVITESAEVIDIETAGNSDLDKIAEIVGEPPRAKDENGEYLINDSDYRENIKTKITINGSHGEREVIIETVKRFLVNSACTVNINVKIVDSEKTDVVGNEFFLYIGGAIES